MTDIAITFSGTALCVEGVHVDTSAKTISIAPGDYLLTGPFEIGPGWVVKGAERARVELADR